MKREKQKAFINLIDKNKGMIRMICRAYAQTEEDTDDYFQEVIIKLWETFNTFRGESSAKTWIYRITLNSCISFVRKKSKQPTIIPLLIDSDITEEDSDYTKNSDKLYKLINCLNKYEKALVMLWLENLSYAEIAEIMGLTVSNVSVKLLRIKEKLKSLSNQYNS